MALLWLPRFQASPLHIIHPGSLLSVIKLPKSLASAWNITTFIWGCDIRWLMEELSSIKSPFLLVISGTQQLAHFPVCKVKCMVSSFSLAAADRLEQFPEKSQTRVLTAFLHRSWVLPTSFWALYRIHLLPRFTEPPSCGSFSSLCALHLNFTYTIVTPDPPTRQT